jgi:hypothetical protein
MSLFAEEARPRLPVRWLPESRWEWLLEAVALGVVLFWVNFLTAHWDALPDRVPSGFDWKGAPRGSAPKSFLWILPAVSLVVYVVMTVASRFPHWGNFPVQVIGSNAPRLYEMARWLLNVIKLQVIATMGYIEWKMVQTARDNAAGLNQWVFVVLVAAVMGTAVYGTWSMRRME